MKTCYTRTFVSLDKYIVSLRIAYHLLYRYILFVFISGDTSSMVAPALLTLTQRTVK